MMLAQPTLGMGTLVAGQLLPGPSLDDATAALASNVCPVGVPVRDYGVTALPVPISYNHWGDLDLNGMLFVPNEARYDLLDDVGSKLVVAGLGEVGQAVLSVRDAIAAGDTYAALDASTELGAATAAALGGESGVPRGRVDVTDLVEPLVLRAFVGECVRVEVTNLLSTPVGFHAHASVMKPGAGGAVGLAANDLVMPGNTATSLVYLPDWPGMEGAHFVHSHADARDQTRHGLFGAIVAEPVGSQWLSMEDASTPAPTGINAIIQMPNGAPDFREYSQFYHDEVELVDWQLDPLPQISPITKEYGVGTKAISLRTEPFYDRFLYNDQLREEGVVARGHDKSESYSSYTYGDPATRFQESYLGDPAKYRMMNAGPGQPHIHHLHGGGIRWRTSPLADPSQFADGFFKADNPVEVANSQRVDVQNINPGESFNIEPEGGSGGTQQSVGDFLYHCHIAEHYLAGMWSFWRVHNVIQPHLAELPDRAGIIKPAVTSDALIGQVYEGETITVDNIDTWVQQFLPARGVAGEEDASVWDWSVATSVAGHPIYLGEPESGIVFPNFPADAPGRVPEGERPELGFDINTGKLAYPHLRPHFAKRPPFAPGHGPAPYLGATATTDKPDGLCPDDARVLKYNLASIPASVDLNRFDTDNNAEVIVMTQDRPGIEAGTLNPTSVILRANSKDCVDVFFVNDLKEDNANHASEGIHRKTNIHIHLVQFDVQASDGVVTGFNYETTVRALEGADGDKPYQYPFDITGDGIVDERDSANVGDPSAPVMTKVSGPVTTGNGVTIVPVKRTSPFFDAVGSVKVGSLVGIGLGYDGTETGRLLAVDATAGTITLEGELQNAHAVGARIGYEFVRYGWYPDVELGIVYFHDHVNGLDTWRHGLYGSLIVEPQNSRWLDPARTTDVAAVDQPTAPVVDIVTPDGVGSFRELALHFMDRGCVRDADCLNADDPQMPHVVDEPAAFNMRADPLWRRDPSAPFSSTALLTDPHGEVAGDPATPLLRAYVGDAVEVRYLYAGQSSSRGVGTFGVTGHRFQAEESLPGSRTIDAIDVAESSHHNMRLECGAGGCQQQPGDYLYYMTNPDYLERGSWGMFRVLGGSDSSLAPLSSNPTPTTGTIGTPTRFYDIAAIQTFAMHNPEQGISSTIERFVPLSVTTGMMGGSATMVPPSPLVIRANAGEVIQVNLTNMLPAGREIGLHAGLVSAGPDNQGITVGNGPRQTVLPGATISYVWTADRELGVVDLVSMADPVNDALRGLYGALVIEPADATWEDDIGPSTLVTLGNGRVAREHVIMFHTEDAAFASSTMPYLPDAQGLTLVNYATEPLDNGLKVRTGIGDARLTGVNSCQIDSGCGPQPTDARSPVLPYTSMTPFPWTPIIRADQGEPLILRFLGSAGTQQVAAQVDGHTFATDPDMDNCRTDLALCKSNLVSILTLGPRVTRNAWIPEAGPGGAGDYVYENHRTAFLEAGAWGILRVS